MKEREARISTPGVFSATSRFLLTLSSARPNVVSSTAYCDSSRTCVRVVSRMAAIIFLRSSIGARSLASKPRAAAATAASGVS